jgi:hypothetical protein
LLLSLQERVNMTFLSFNWKNKYFEILHVVCISETTVLDTKLFLPNYVQAPPWITINVYLFWKSPRSDICVVWGNPIQKSLLPD